MRSIQEIFDIAINERHYKKGDFMCVALIALRDRGQITDDQRKEASVEAQDAIYSLAARHGISEGLSAGVSFAGVLLCIVSLAIYGKRMPTLVQRRELNDLFYFKREVSEMLYAMYQDWDRRDQYLEGFLDNYIGYVQRNITK